MDSLFSEIEQNTLDAAAPLAARMRPRTLDELVGQDEAVGEGTWLRRAILDDALSSIILYGPAGTGKTSIARVIARATDAHFAEVSAVSGSVADLRREIEQARNRLLMQNRRTILFVDEIHRFSRSQQDALLHAVEDRIVILIGATTENPFFEVNTALNSRSRIIELNSLSDDALGTLIAHALTDARGLAGGYVCSASAVATIVTTAGGDGRSALSTLEAAAEVAQAVEDLDDAGRAELAEGTVPPDSEIPASGGARIILRSTVLEAVPHRMHRYDKKGDVHYDVISAFIKSMRGSDPDAAVYWLARMIEGGEDPRFIARRIFICASEDIGNADPQALLVAEAAFKAAESIGYPECRINLAQAAIYLALAPKSNAAESAIDTALAEVRNGPERAVPNHLRDRHRPGSEEYGPYLYPHSYPGGWVEQRYLPDGLEQGAFYHPGERGWEHYRTQATKGDRRPGGVEGVRRAPKERRESGSAPSSGDGCADTRDRP